MDEWCERVMMVTAAPSASNDVDDEQTGDSLLQSAIGSTQRSREMKRSGYQASEGERGESLGEPK